MCSLGEESAVREGLAYPAKPTRPSKKNYRQSYSKVCKCRCSNLHSISDIEQGLHMTLAETLRQRCLVSDAWFEYSSATT